MDSRTSRCPGLRPPPRMGSPTLCERAKGPTMRSGGVQAGGRSGQSLHPDPEPGGCVREVAGDVAQIEGVTSAEAVTGPYDVIPLVEARNLDELGRLVVGKVQAIEGVTRTLTCPVVRL